MLTADYDALARAQVLTTMLQRAANDGDDVSVVDLIRRGADPVGAGKYLLTRFFAASYLFLS